MLITGKELKNVRVYTQSGQYLGKVHDFEIDTDTGNVVTYHVKAAQMIPGLFNDSLLIQKNDVIDFDKEQMIVRDRVGKVLESDDAMPHPLPSPTTPVTSKS